MADTPPLSEEMTRTPADLAVRWDALSAAAPRLGFALPDHEKFAGTQTGFDKYRKACGIKQLKRTPYITGFRAGWKTFSLINVHLHPGDGADDLALRGQEVRLLLAAIAEKKKQHGLWTRHALAVDDGNRSIQRPKKADGG